MKIALISDMHWGVRNDHPAFLTHFEKFFSKVFFPYLDNAGINTVIDLGDTFDKRKYVNINTLNRANKIYFNEIEKRNIDLHIIIGNHTTYFRNTNDVNTIHSIFSERFKTYIKTEEVEFDGVKILFVPWLCENNRQHSLELIGNTNAQICFGHLELAGFEMHRGSPVSSGDDPSLFSRFDIVCSGHFHHRSNISRIYYLGNHCEFTWSDFDDPKGFHIFDTETREIEFIRNPYTLFKKIWYDDDAILTDYFLEQFRGCIIKVIVKNRSNPYQFDKFIEAIEKVNPIEIQVVEDHLNLDLESVDDLLDEAESTLSIFKNYIEGIDLKSVDKKKLETKITELYNEALEIK